MSFAPEVQADSTGKWYGNALRFPTHDEAQANVSLLSCNWSQVRATRVVESDDPPNYRFINGGLVPYSKLAQALLLDEQKGGK